MVLRRILGVPVSLMLALFGVSSITIAQDATPAAVPGAVVASGLTNPRGFIVAADELLYVALAGSGGSTAATEDSPAAAILGPFTGGPTGAVARIESGCPVAVVTGLPSTLLGSGEVLGAEDVAILNGELYVSTDGGGPSHGNPDAPAGVYRALADGTFELIADLSAYLRANPAAIGTEFPDYDPDADGYRMVADEAAGMLWVLEPNAGGVLSVTPDGFIARIADLSEGHPVPSAIALAPDGSGVYIGNLTAVPFPDGAAKVIKVTPDGAVSDVWTGLTTVTGVAVGPDGTLYALEMSTGNLEEPPFLMPGTGRIVRMTGPDTLEVVAEGLMFPIHLAVAPDGVSFYVSMPAIGANDGSGMIMQIGMDDAASPAADTGGTPPACDPIPETLYVPEGTPMASPEA